MYGRIDGPVDGEVPAPLQAVWDSLTDSLPPEPVRREVSRIRLVLRATAFLSMTGALLVPYLLALPFGRRVPDAVARLWHRGARRLCGLRLWLNGSPTAAPGAVYVANHVSYLDIPVLGGLIDATFVAKSDVVDR